MIRKQRHHAGDMAFGFVDAAEFQRVCGADDVANRLRRQTVQACSGNGILVYGHWLSVVFGGVETARIQKSTDSKQ